MSYLNIIYNRPNVCNLVNNSNKMFDNIAAMWQLAKSTTFVLTLGILIYIKELHTFKKKIQSTYY